MNARIETNGFHGEWRYHLQMMYNLAGLLNTADFSHATCGGEKREREKKNSYLTLVYSSDYSYLIFAASFIIFAFASP